MALKTDVEILRAAIQSCSMSVSTPHPVMFNVKLLQMMHDWTNHMVDALLTDVLPWLDEDAEHDIRVACTTSFHEGFRLGQEYARMGGSPPEGIH